MFATLSRLVVSVSLVFGLGGPVTDIDVPDAPDSLRPAVAGDDRAGNFDPNGFTEELTLSPPLDDESSDPIDLDWAADS